MAVEFLFQIEFQKADIKEQVEDFLDSLQPDNFDKNYFFEIVNGVLNSQAEIDELISKNAKGWTLDRIAKVDLAILRVAIYEIRHREDIPLSVSINEAVEIAKKFGTDESGKFINGLLAQI
ncbi:MAG: transcription antitermination factor NusB [Clostridiales bacterium]|nr:transcription antitermination factor NusB [Clostridiales bacterium]